MVERCRLITTWLLICSTLLHSMPLRAEQVPVRYSEGLLHGFLALLTLDGKRLADGDLTQIARGDLVTSHLVFRFRDGSIYDETTRFSQKGVFRLLDDHLVEHGPSFTQPTDTLLDAYAGRIMVRYRDKNGKEEVISQRQDVPVDVANGLLFTILKDIQPTVPKTTVSYVVAAPAPRIVKLEIVPEGKEQIRSGNIVHQTVRYDVKVKIPGITGILAHLFGKLPPDTHIWILPGIAPVFVKFEGPLYQGGPIWRAQVIPAQFAAPK
jgi:hypothetical protein